MAGTGLAVVSVVSSGVVGALGVVVPALTARGNRAHESALRTADRRASEQDRVWERRAAVYEAAIATAITMEKTAGAAQFESEGQDQLADLQGRLFAWGSPAVRDAWWAFARLLPTDAASTVDFDTTDVNKAVFKLINLVNAELRGTAE